MIGLPPTPTTASTPVANSAASTGTQQPQSLKLPAHMQNHINEMNFQPPPNVPDRDKWLQEIKIKYGRALLTMEHARAGLSKVELMVKERREKGSAISADEEKMVIERKAAYQKQHSEAASFVSSVRKQYTAQNGAHKPGPMVSGVAAAAQAGNQVRPQGQVRQVPPQSNVTPVGGQVPGGGGGGPMQQSTATVNAAFEAAKNQQRMAGANVLPGQQTTSTAAAAQVQSAPVSQAPPSQAAPPQHLAPQQAPIKIEPGVQNPNIPAPLNTAIAAGLAPAMQASGTPTQNSARVQTPQSATPNNTTVRPLTHAAAINLAGQQRPGSISGPPGSATGSGPSVIGGQQGHSHAHPPTQPTQPAGQTIQSKLPIPKVLPEKATQVPTPVAVMGGGRPTYTGGSGIAGGVMNQPALAKTPAYQLEGEGERVLNKKKLDELVRQVCGGTAEGQDGNMLTPEVEEVSDWNAPSRSRDRLNVFSFTTGNANQLNSLFSILPITSSTMFCMPPAATPRSADPRYSRFATCSLFSSAPTIHVFPATLVKSCERLERFSLMRSGLPK